MRINFDANILNLDGTPLEDQGKPVTLGLIVGLMLLAPEDPRQSSPDGKEKLAKFDLAVAIHAGGQQDISVEDVVLLKKVVGQHPLPLIVGRAFELLDQDSSRPESKPRSGPLQVAK